MNHDDPERRIADLERQMAEQKRTPQQVHNVAFSDASRSRGYRRDDVDAIVGRIEATLRDPTASGGITPADIHNVAFSKPPIGQRGYNEGDVDAYLDRAKIELTRGTSAPGLEQPKRCLLYRLGSSNPQQPVLAIDVDKGAIRVINLDSNALVGSASLAEVTAKPAQHGGAPVLIVDVPGLEPLTIQPHLIAGFSRREQSGGLVGKVASSKRPEYIVVDDDWLPLVEALDAAPDLENLPTPRKIYGHISDFFSAAHRPGFTWQWFVLFGMVILIPACIYWAPTVILIGVTSLIMAVVAWYFGWGQLR